MCVCGLMNVLEERKCRQQPSTHQLHCESHLDEQSKPSMATMMRAIHNHRKEGPILAKLASGHASQTCGSIPQHSQGFDSLDHAMQESRGISRGFSVARRSGADRHLDPLPGVCILAWHQLLGGS
jgi:hypothetical protein